MPKRKLPPKEPVPHTASDHDERSERPATDIEWSSQDAPADASMQAGGRITEFKRDAVPLSDEDWEEEESDDDEIPDHVSKAVDASLEAMAEQEEEEMADEEEE